ncbi:hypothetical protein BD779DRAFT_1793990 [Infundibulicybe gibba]|nr:hypothetical protein BD779DRAFT_1793990 [Infundibulicybe gibba]
MLSIVVPLVGCDLLNLLFVFDEYTDITDPNSVRQQADIVMDALYNPHTTRPAARFWENAIKTATPAFQWQFKSAFKNTRTGSYKKPKIGLTTTFGTLRTIFLFGVTPLDCFRLSLYSQSKFILTCIDLVIIGNDLYSYNVEQVTYFLANPRRALGEDGHNLIKVVMHEQGSTLEEAVAWISGLNDDLIEVCLEESLWEAKSAKFTISRMKIQFHRLMSEVEVKSKSDLRVISTSVCM